uniref:Uncharacterized protein n=1 Tax=Knipowitschia caucasica TaxID=637954 RepID=A0AAV2KVG1_KNICA
MFENCSAHRQSPQGSRPSTTRRSPAAASHGLGSNNTDISSAGGQQRLKNAINLGKAKMSDLLRRKESTHIEDIGVTEVNKSVELGWSLGPTSPLSPLEAFPRLQPPPASGKKRVLRALKTTQDMMISSVPVVRSPEQAEAGSTPDTPKKALPTAEKDPPMAEEDHPTTEKDPPMAEEDHPTTEKDPPMAEEDHPTTDKDPPMAETDLPMTEKELQTAEMDPPTPEKDLTTAENTPSPIISPDTGFEKITESTALPLPPELDEPSCLLDMALEQSIPDLIHQDPPDPALTHLTVGHSAGEDSSPDLLSFE